MSATSLANGITAETRRFGVAIVGCGIIGETHADAIAEVDGVSVAALIDSRLASAEALADRVAASAGGRPRVAGSLSEILAAGVGPAGSEPAGHGIDIVVICAPSGLHVQLAEDAIAAGLHVIIEKPLDVSVPRARRIAELAAVAERRGLLISVISQHRFDPASEVVHRAIEAGDLGRVTSGIASIPWWRSQDYYNQATWRGTWQLDGGGALMNQGVHTIDLLLWMLGRPVEINGTTALLAHEGIEVEDVGVATVRFESGALAVIHGTTAAYPGLPVRLEVLGSHGSAVIEDDALAYFHAATLSDRSGPASVSTTDPTSAVGNIAAQLVPPSELPGGVRDPRRFVLGHARQYEDVVAAIRLGRPPLVTVRDALVALATVRAVYLSSTLGRAVLLDEVLDGSLDEIDVRTGSRS